MNNPDLVLNAMDSPLTVNLPKLLQKLQQFNDSFEEMAQVETSEISDSQMSILAGISKQAEKRNAFTEKHVERSQLFCQMLTQELRKESAYEDIITDAYIRNIYYAAALHDVGKIGISDQLLLKTEELTPEEYDILKKHVDIGKRALREVLNKNKNSQIIKMGLEMTSSHHEKWDGSGYPEGLYGQDIPLSARIMALVDVYEALRAKRPYKEALTHKKSVQIIKEGGGIHFDPSVVKAFTNIESKFAEIYDMMKEDGPN